MTALSTEMLTSGDYASKSWSEPGTTQDRWVIVNVPPRLAPLAHQLEGLLALGEGWNSYRAKRVRPEAVASALRLLTNWSGPLPSVSPTTRGGVQLEWGGDDEGVEITFLPDGFVSVLVDANASMSEHLVASFEDPALFDALIWAEKLA